MFREAECVMKDIGKHLLADLYGANPALLADEQTLMKLLRSALDYAQFTIVDQLSFTFPGEGSGVTGVFLLSESHAAFHTYPEIPYMALDIFSCGAADPEVVLAHLISVLRPARFSTAIQRRGKNCRPAVGVAPTYQLTNMVGAS
jgi:S-adenosylmethionine decarboxylase